VDPATVAFVEASSVISAEIPNGGDDVVSNTLAKTLHRSEPPAGKGVTSLTVNETTNLPVVGVIAAAGTFSSATTRGVAVNTPVFGSTTPGIPGLAAVVS
jgi:hypothetical protein